MYTQVLMTSIIIDGRRIQVMIDTGTSENFILQMFMDRNRLSIQNKDNEVYDLVIIDGNLLSSEDGRVVEEIKPLSVAIQRHHEELTFNILQITNHDVVLDMP